MSFTDCNRPLVHALSDRSLLAHGQSDPASLSDRNRDRVRLSKAIASRPEGCTQSWLAWGVLKASDRREDDFWGTPPLNGAAGGPGELLRPGASDIRLDGSDADFQFVNRFVNDLEDADLVRTDALSGDNCRQRLVVPTPSLLDLISEGIIETASGPAKIHSDRDFAEKMLQTPWPSRTGLSNRQKEWLGEALLRYIHRTRQYRLLFDVFALDPHGIERRRTTKRYKTRFTDRGRMDKGFARLQSALEWGYENADSAVFCTLTTDPKRHDSVFDATRAISKNFHRLTQFFKTDPDTVRDTREESCPQWTPDLDSSKFYFGAEGAVSGRPREKLEYVKVLEFDGGGKPHLHVLFFDPPAREHDGMPWLIDKDELSHRWGECYDHGEIVDLYPLTYRDDLDELEGAKFNDSEGFVCWYQHGDHSYSDEWIAERQRYHQNQGQIDMAGHDGHPRQKTAGAYIGKYISETYQALQTAVDLESDPDSSLTEAALSGDGKAAPWKLAMYWATGLRFWSPSNTIRDAIALDPDPTEVRRAVIESTMVSVDAQLEDRDLAHRLREPVDRGQMKRSLKQILRELEDERRRSSSSNLSSSLLIRYDLVGTYHVDDLPADNTPRVDAESIEASIHDPDSPVQAAATDRPPPIASVW